jgi:hypothetical protein
MKWYYAIFVLVVAAFSLAAAWSIPLETTVEVLPMVITVTDEQLGVHMTEEPQKEFNFGSTFPGTTVIKTMNITRGNQPPAMVSMSVQGSIAPWVELSAYDFLLDEPEQIAVAVRVPAEAPEGAYSGNLTITYKKTLISRVSSRWRW